jgi:uncharacterized phage protein (TIGR02216 family)
MIAGLGTLGLAPRDFWALTPRELDAALRGHYGLGPASAPLSRASLTTLMRSFPDA